ncbi:hypothetical protein Leryth_009684, partial [Lithospermum erythrorhizon]
YKKNIVFLYDQSSIILLFLQFNVQNEDILKGQTISFDAEVSVQVFMPCETTTVSVEELSNGIQRDSSRVSVHWQPPFLVAAFPSFAIAFPVSVEIIVISSLSHPFAKPKTPYFERNIHQY